MYDEVITVLETKYQLSTTHAGSLAEDVSDERYNELEESGYDAYDIAGMIYDGDI